jgi:branched-chain amino acid transport system substrate-binding protein
MKKKKLAGAMASFMLAAGVMAGCSAQGNNASGGDSKTIKIGVNMELSGGVASYGQSLTEGLELGVKEINKKGINGSKIQLVKVDNKSDAAEATNAALKLISQDKVSAIVGPATSTDTKAEIQIATDNKVPVITPSGTAEDITVSNGKLNDFVFRTCFIDSFQGIVAANFASKNLNLKNAAVLIDSASDYSKGLSTAFKTQFKKNGGKVVSEEAYVAKDTDFHATLTRIKAANPDFIYLPGYYEEAGLIVKQAREIGFTGAIIGGDGWDSPKLVELAGAQALNNTYSTNHYSSQDTDQTVQDFVKAFKAEYNGKSPDTFNALGYDTAYMLADAIKRAGSSDPQKIQQALVKTSDLKLVTGNLKLDKNHNPIKSAVILEYKNGQSQFKTKVNP